MARARRHPAARHDTLRAKAAEVSEKVLPESGWIPRYGWLIMIRCYDGTRCMRDVPPVPYKEAAEVRDRELYASERYESAWLYRRIAPSPYDEGRLAPKDRDADQSPNIPYVDDG